LVLSNPTLPEITDGYEIKLHHSLGHDHIVHGIQKQDGNGLAVRKPDYRL